MSFCNKTNNTLIVDNVKELLNRAHRAQRKRQRKRRPHAAGLSGRRRTVTTGSSARLVGHAEVQDSGTGSTRCGGGE